MCVAVQPFVDTSISKTVNVPADVPDEDFKDLYLMAWRYGSKGITTYRPNDVLGAVLEVGVAGNDQPTIWISMIRIGVSAWKKRTSRHRLWPVCAGLGGRNCPTAIRAGPIRFSNSLGRFAVFVGHVDNGEGGKPYPFEVWVNGRLVTAARSGSHCQDAVHGHARR